MRNARWVVIAVLVATAGCADPVVGKWEASSETACLIGGPDRVEFDIEGDLTGSGEVCGCDFELTVTNEGNDEYEAEVDYDGNCLLGDVEIDCELSSDGEELDCGTSGEFERVE